MQAIFGGQLRLLGWHVVAGQVLPRSPRADAGDHRAGDSKLFGQCDRAFSQLQAFIDAKHISRCEFVAAGRQGLKTCVDCVLGVLLRRAVFKVGQAVVSFIAVAVVNPCPFWARTNKGEHHKAVDSGLLVLPYPDLTIALWVIAESKRPACQAKLSINTEVMLDDRAVEAANHSVVADLIAKMTRNGLE